MSYDKAIPWTALASDQSKSAYFHSINPGFDAEVAENY